MKNKDNSYENEFNKIGEIGSSKFFVENCAYKCGGGAITQYPPS